MAHFKKQILSGTSPGMFLRRGHRVGIMPPNSHFSCRIMSHVETGTSAYRAHIDFFHTKNHTGSKSLTHRWKGEIKGSDLHYFFAQESSTKADF